jgi:hypothetical protein
MLFAILAAIVIGTYAGCIERNASKDGKRVPAPAWSVTPPSSGRTGPRGSCGGR